MKNYMNPSTIFFGQKYYSKALHMALGLAGLFALLSSSTAYANGSVTRTVSNTGSTQSHSISQHSTFTANSSATERTSIDDMLAKYAKKLKVVRVSKRLESPYKNAAQLEERLRIVTNELKIMRYSNF